MQKSWNKKPNTHSLMPNDKEMAFEMKAKQAEEKTRITMATESKTIAEKIAYCTHAF